MTITLFILIERGAARLYLLQKKEGDVFWRKKKRLNQWNLKGGLAMKANMSYQEVLFSAADAT